jgi:hypothetical protein
MKGGSSGMLYIGGMAIPTGPWSIKVAPGTKPMKLPALVDFTVTMTLTWDAEVALAILETYRWSEYLTRQFRGMPGMRFADLMRGTGRN